MRFLAQIVPNHAVVLQPLAPLPINFSFEMTLALNKFRKNHATFCHQEKIGNLTKQPVTGWLITRNFGTRIYVRIISSNLTNQFCLTGFIEKGQKTGLETTKEPGTRPSLKASTTAHLST